MTHRLTVHVHKHINKTPIISAIPPIKAYDILYVTVLHIKSKKRVRGKKRRRRI